MKLFTIIAIVMLTILVGCQTSKTTIVDETRVIVLEPPASLLKCPQIKKEDIPDPDNLTNIELIKFIEKYDRALRTCGINMNKIREYIERAKAQLQSS